MKKTLTINISGTVFHIDEDAYEKLQEYLYKINSQFGSESEGREIIQDIEARISELFSQRIKNGDEVINLEMVGQIIDTMGMPEDFTDDEDVQEGAGSHIRNRRLYRDPEHRVVAGVCSGLGAYFGMDPAILRIVFVVLVILSSNSWFLFSGFWVVMTYIVLWIAVPKAITTAQRLEMRGEDINISNIKRSIKEEYSEVKEKYRNFRSSSSYKKGRERMDEFGEVAYSGAGLLLRVFIKLVGVLLIFTGVVSLFALIISMFAGCHMSHCGFWEPHILPYLNIFFFSGQLFWLWIGILLGVGIPILLMIFVGTKLLFKYRTSNMIIGLSSLGLWIAGVIILLFVTISQFGNFTESAGRTINVPLSVRSNVLYLTMNDHIENLDDENTFDFNGMRVFNTDSGRVVVGKPSLTIKKSDGSNFILEIHYTSKGKDEADARNNQKMISYAFNPKDTILSFSPYFSLSKKIYGGIRKLN